MNDHRLDHVREVTFNGRDFHLVPADWYAALQAVQPYLKGMLLYYEEKGRDRTVAALRAALLPTPKE